MQQSETKSVTLQFTNLASLWAFSQTLSRRECAINTRLRTLSCVASSTEIEKAQAQFDASLLDKTEAQRRLAF